MPLIVVRNMNVVYCVLGVLATLCLGMYCYLTFHCTNCNYKSYSFIVDPISAYLNIDATYLGLYVCDLRFTRHMSSFSTL